MRRAIGFERVSPLERRLCRYQRTDAGIGRGCMNETGMVILRCVCVASDGSCGVCVCMCVCLFGRRGRRMTRSYSSVGRAQC